MYKVLFVCSGNTCRSPIAQGILQKMIGDDKELMVGSCGLGAFQGDDANEKAIATCEEIGVNIKNHKSFPFVPEFIQDFDLILTMTKAHRDRLLLSFPSAKDKVFGVCEYSDDLIGQEFENIKDPFGLGQDEYKACRTQLEEKLKLVYDKISKLK